MMVEMMDGEKVSCSDEMMVDMMAASMDLMMVAC